MKVRKVTVIFRKSPDGWWSEVKEMPGCYSQGQTLPECVKNTAEAIEGWLDAKEYVEGDVFLKNLRKHYKFKKSPSRKTGLKRIIKEAQANPKIMAGIRRFIKKTTNPYKLKPGEKL